MSNYTHQTAPAQFVEAAGIRYSIPAGGKKSVNAVWLYEHPFPAVVRIRGMSRSIPSGSMK
jgi:uncharacterized protein (DUF427 family)